MKMSHLLGAALLAGPLFLGLAPSAAHAEDAMIVIAQPWARATPSLNTPGAVYLTITDNGAADKLVGVSTPAAGMAMVHESYTENGISKMRMLDGVKLEPHKTVTFQPGGLHIMLEDLKAPLRVGGTFPLTLTFAKAPPQTVVVKVLKPGAEAPMPDMKDMPGMKMN
jgi:hypothetical protein